MKSADEMLVEVVSVALSVEVRRKYLRVGRSKIQDAVWKIENCLKQAILICHSPRPDLTLRSAFIPSVLKRIVERGVQIWWEWR